jgi:ABC-type Mn2+/Zn2+ transport system ATPase subunit
MAFVQQLAVYKRKGLFRIPPHHCHQCKTKQRILPVCMAKKKAAQPQEVDVFGAAGLSQEELLKQALENIESTKSKKKSTSESNKNPKKTEAKQEEKVERKPTTKQKQQQQQPPPTAAAAAKEEPIQDPEAKKEYEQFLSQVEAFTVSGRQKQRAKGGAQNRISKNDVDGYRHSQGVSWIRMQDVTLYFGSVKLLSNVTWEVKSGDRIGLVGDNGSGKTTMLKILAGLITPDSGEVIKSSPRVRTAFLKQEFIDELCPTRTLKEEFLSVFEEENKMLQEYQQLEDKIANVGADENNLEYMEELLNQLETYRTKCEDNDVWNLETRIERLLPQLGFLPEDTSRPVSSFSGGWKVRIGLGKVLLKKPDILLLDEPTNHVSIYGYFLSSKVLNH